MFQRKIDEIFKEMQNVFGIADDISIVGYKKDGTDHRQCCTESSKYTEKKS